MNTKHTPGPWYVNKSVFSPFCLQEDHIGTPSLTVACVYTDTSADKQKIEEINANKKLIAAAPDMLAALEELAETAPLDIEAEDSVNEYRKFVMRTARKAITKATQ